MFHRVSLHYYAAYSGYRINSYHEADCRTCRRLWTRPERPSKAEKRYSAAVIEVAQILRHASKRTRKAEGKNMTRNDGANGNVWLRRAQGINARCREQHKDIGEDVASRTLEAALHFHVRFPATSDRNGRSGYDASRTFRKLRYAKRDLWHHQYPEQIFT